MWCQATNAYWMARITVDKNIWTVKMKHKVMMEGLIDLDVFLEVCRARYSADANREI
jgi:hypothetical protein